MGCLRWGWRLRRTRVLRNLDSRVCFIRDWGRPMRRLCLVMLNLRIGCIRNCGWKRRSAMWCCRGLRFYGAGGVAYPGLYTGRVGIGELYRLCISYQDTLVYIEGISEYYHPAQVCQETIVPMNLCNHKLPKFKLPRCEIKLGHKSSIDSSRSIYRFLRMYLGMSSVGQTTSYSNKNAGFRRSMISSFNKQSKMNRKKVETLK